jgi:hypothetical protein
VLGNLTVRRETITVIPVIMSPIAQIFSWPLWVPRI